MKGFTLIEIIIYVALLSLTIGFILAGVYQILDSKTGVLARTSVEEEANFLMKKIKWAMTGVDAVNQPTAGATSTTLSVNKFNFSANPVAIHNPCRARFSNSAAAWDRVLSCCVDG